MIFARRTIRFALAAAIFALSACGDESAPPAPAKVADTSARYPIAQSAAETEPINAYIGKRYVHGPVAQNACDACHEPSETEGEVGALLRGPIETCTFCHNIGSIRSHPHAPAVDAATGCTSCHDPHASQTKFLLTAPSVAALCSTCHETPMKKHMHDPVAQGQCTLCHLPHEADNAKLLRGGEGNDHCFACHKEMGTRMTNSPFVHEPVAEDCKTCHDPHASDHPFELSAPVAESCFTCHGDLEKAVAGATSPHAAVFTGKQCANCHDPHATGREHLLSDRVDHLCMQCHDKEIKTSSGRTIANMKPLIEDRAFLHGPVKAGQCDACHNAHGSTHTRLLRANFTDDFYANFDESIYALCFTCHDKQLVQTEKTTTLTNFRNGDVNLHYIHVHRDTKGRTCKTCHAIHGSDLPNHMATAVPFEDSNWAMPLKYKKFDTGGSCAPGCHEPYTYQRSEEGAP